MHMMDDAIRQLYAYEAIHVFVLSPLSLRADADAMLRFAAIGSEHAARDSETMKSAREIYVYVAAIANRAVRRDY